MANLLPRVFLPEVLLEIQARTGFLGEFTHISDANARVTDLPVSICAVLVAEACNIGLDPLVHSDIPALRRGRLTWVQQNYIRAETLTKANDWAFSEIAWSSTRRSTSFGSISYLPSASDDREVARAIHHGEELDAVYSLNEVGLLDEFWHFLSLIGVLQLVTTIAVPAVERVMIPIGFGVVSRSWMNKGLLKPGRPSRFCWHNLEGSAGMADEW